jgi:voltage-gated potassium channel
MNEILDMDDHAEIVVIDSKPKAPIEDHRICYIQGDPTDTETLDRANVLNAKSALIFTQDSEFNPVAADGKSLLIVSAIEGYAIEKNNEIYTIVEILKEKHISTFKHANVDEFVIADEALSDLMAKSAVNKGSSKLIMKLLSRKSGVDLRRISKQKRWHTYNDAFEDLKNLGASLISDSDDFNVLTKLDKRIPDDAELYIICNDEVYQRITSIS